MGSISCCHFTIICFLIILFKHVHIFAVVSSSSVQPLCHDYEQSALLQFKHSFSNDSLSTCSNPKISSWKLGNKDCCSWEGVICDMQTGHVTGLELSNTCLYGTINSSSTIFHLAHLSSLDLSANNFMFSHVSPRFENLSMLTHLNLSYSWFAGQMPSELSKLSQLVSLDLSGNDHLSFPSDGLRSIARNLTKLRQLHLNEVNVSSSIPHDFANVTTLTSLLLRNSGLLGDFPVGIFMLPNLEVVDIMSNANLSGYLPEFPAGIRPLKKLLLASTGFDGKLPLSIDNLRDLEVLDIGDCSFTGSVPPSIGKLTKLSKMRLTRNQFRGEVPSSLENLTSLSNLSLAYNDFSPTQTLPWLTKLTKLTCLYLAKINLRGNIPHALSNLTKIEILHLSYNELTGEIPYWLGNLKGLRRLGLAANKLEGTIPSSIFELKSLEFLHLLSNNLTGTVRMDMLSELKNLTRLQLSYNRLSVLTNISNDFFLPKLKLLSLDSCNMSEFPKFLQNQDKLKALTLSSNRISGHLPTWVLNMSRETLLFVNLSHNYLTRLDKSMAVLPWFNLKVVDLSFNMLQGSLPLPSPSTLFYSVANNKLTGEIPPKFCNAANLRAIDLSNNHLSGTIPWCLGNSITSLSMLNLKGNTFHGIIPEIGSGSCSLRSLDLSHNKLEGQIPREIRSCQSLERLDLGNNRINDTFPSWLGSLPELQILILRNNIFHGMVGPPESKADFPMLRIVDLSNNFLIGNLPNEYFRLWKAMNVSDTKSLKYMQQNFEWNMFFANANWSGYYDYSMTMTMTNKGTELVYQKISNILTAINLSGNKFTGRIPDSIGSLKGLRLLDLSKNRLSGHMPPILGQLALLESMDLSQNKLAGQIPQQFVKLTYLVYLNLTNNLLTGPIPQGNQFSTFLNNSFFGNKGLCGYPLSQKCEPPPSVPQHSIHIQGDEGLFGDFQTGVGMGCGVGLVVGIALGQVIIRSVLPLRVRKLTWRNRRNRK